jgi:hypothetical protein
MKRIITRSAIAVLALAVIAVMASRQIAIVHGDAFMRQNLTENWVRLRCSPMLGTMSWDLVYGTDILTGTPPYVEVSFLGRIRKTNVTQTERTENVEPATRPYSEPAARSPQR